MMVANGREKQNCWIYARNEISELTHSSFQLVALSFLHFLCRVNYRFTILLTTDYCKLQISFSKNTDFEFISQITDFNFFLQTTAITCYK